MPGLAGFAAGAHGHVAHEHGVGAPHIHLRGGSFATLPFVVGLVHGLAGSGALASVVMGHSSSVGVGLLFLDPNRPWRMRVHGRGRVSTRAEDCAPYTGAQAVLTGSV